MQKKISVYENKYLLGFILFCCFQPGYLEQITVINDIYTYLNLFILSFLIILIIIEHRITKTMLWVLCFFGFQFIITLLIKPENAFPYIKSNALKFILCIVFDMWMQKNPKLLFRASEYLDVYVYINLLTMILYPDGLYESELYTLNWFLGYKNLSGKILPILCISVINSYITHNKLSLRTILLIIISLITAFLSQSANCLVLTVLFVVLLFLFHSKNFKIPKAINLLTITISTFILSLLLTFTDLVELFNFFIEGVLHKSGSFAGRKNLWIVMVEYIDQSPIFGNGYWAGKDFVEATGSRWFTHTHNFLLYLLVTGGIILVLIFIIGLIRASKKIVLFSDRIESKIVFFVLVSFMINGITEALVGVVFLYPLFVLAMNIDKVCMLSSEI